MTTAIAVLNEQTETANREQRRAAARRRADSFR